MDSGGWWQDKSPERRGHCLLGPWIFLPKHCSPQWFCFEKRHLSPKSLECRVQVAFVQSNFPNVQKSSCKCYCLPPLAFKEEMLSRNTPFVLLMGKNISQTLAHACSPRIINLRSAQTPEKFQVQPELSWSCLQKSGAGCVEDRALAQPHKMSLPSQLSGTGWMWQTLTFCWTQGFWLWFCFLIYLNVVSLFLWWESNPEFWAFWATDIPRPLNFAALANHSDTHL